MGVRELRSSVDSRPRPWFRLGSVQPSARRSPPSRGDGGFAGHGNDQSPAAFTRGARRGRCRYLPRIAAIHKAACAQYETVRGRGSDRDQKRSDPVVCGMDLSGDKRKQRSVFPADGEGPPVNASRAFLLIGRTRAPGTLAQAARGGVSVGALAVANVPSLNIGQAA